MTPPPGLPRLVLLTDRRQARAAGHDLVELVAAAAAAGAPLVVLREKDLPPPERLALARALAAVLGPNGAALGVASDAQLAAAAGADVVHLAAADPPPGRAGAGGRPVYGRSCHGAADLQAARREGAAYATLSPVFPTASKPGYGPALGPEGLAAACSAVPGFSVLALGGVTADRVAQCLQAGAHGVAVMGEVMRAADPGAAVRELVAALAVAGPAPRGGGR